MDTLELLKRLVAFDTVSSKSNLDLIDWAADYVSALGAVAEIVPGAREERASLWARFGPDVPGGVVLSGHSDVVPVEGQAWDTAPFELVETDGRVYGRGTSDMKGFVACALSVLTRAETSNLKRPIYVALTYDEEIGCQGAPHLISWLKDRGVDAEAVFVGEPTSMRVVNAHKGIAVCRVDIRGVEAHSSLVHEGVSAIALAGRAITLLADVEAEFRTRASDERFTPSYATMSPNLIEGGEATNILAGHCSFHFDLRVIPGVTAQEVVDRFADRLEAEIIAPERARIPGCDAVCALMTDTPGLAALPESPAERLATRLTGDNQALAVPYGAEAGLYQRGGLSAVLIGPGSIEQAHQPNEFIDISQLRACEVFLERVVAEMSA
ncbi:MAG: acetylornithine deacetylase [Pseudomonadota bacterium]